jgi:hypothetical protein
MDMLHRPSQEQARVNPALERLFLFEVEFHRHLRETHAPFVEAKAIHTSWALESGYERLMAEAAPVSTSEVEKLAQRHLCAGDPRDILAARDSVQGLLCRESLPR